LIRQIWDQGEEGYQFES